MQWKCANDYVIILLFYYMNSCGKWPRKHFMTRTKNNEVNLLLSALTSHVHIILVPSFPPQNNIIIIV